MKFVVTGGGGFVGKALCKALKAKGYEVVALARGDYPELLQMGVDLIRFDLSQNPEQLAAYFAGAEAVFHTAAKVLPFCGPYEDFYRNNVVATQNVISACLQSGVKNLIYTSTPSVVCDGTDLQNVDESYPYPDHFDSFYPMTKALAERIVLGADSDNLHTLSVRPHLIWGPGDTHLIPEIVKRAKAGRLIGIGKGQNKVDVCYIDDCVQAHLKAYAALKSKPEARGRAYFISQGEPVNLGEFVNKILAIYKLPPIKRRIPYGVALVMATVMEWVSNCLPGHPEPLLSRFLVKEMATDHYFNISAARRVLDYQPQFTVDEALEHFKKKLRDGSGALPSN